MQHTTSIEIDVTEMTDYQREELLAELLDFTDWDIAQKVIESHVDSTELRDWCRKYVEACGEQTQ